MSYGLGKRTNEYARALDQIDAPKAVWAAIAFAFADRLTGLHMDDHAIHTLIMDEWQALHDNGIVPQKPRKG
jgi:hypothetical protein